VDHLPRHGRVRYAIGKGLGITAGYRIRKLQCSSLGSGEQNDSIPSGLAMMMNEAVRRVLDETIEAFIVMDLAKLEKLEDHIVALSQSNMLLTENSKQNILEKKRMLEIILQNSEANLLMLTRLHDRNAGSQWAR
jgi:hypothetical protein